MKTIRLVGAQAGVVATLALGQYGRLLVSVASAPILARALGANGRGEFALFATYEIFVSLLLGGGLAQAFAFELRTASSVDERRSALRQANQSIAAVVKRTVFVAPLCGGTAAIFLGVEQSIFVVIFTLIAPSAVAYGMHRQLAAIDRRDRAYALIDGMPALILGIGVISLYLAGQLAIRSALLLLAVSRGSRFLLGWPLWPHGEGRQDVSDAFKRYGRRAMPSTLAQLAQGSAIQVALIPAGIASVGQFAVAQVWSNLLNPLYLAAGTHIFRSAARTPPLLLVLAALSVPALLLAASSFLLMPLLYGSEFDDATSLAATLSIGSVGIGAFLIYRSCLDRSGRPELSSKIQLGHLAMVAITVPLAVVYFELDGVAVVVALLMLSRGVIAGVVARRLLPSPELALDR